jgi:hypothetical protein
MLKTGISAIKDMSRRKTRLGASRAIAYSVLNSARSVWNSSNIFEQIVSTIRMSSGVYRTTKPGRFRDLDAMLEAVLKEYFPPSKALRVEDWASSDALAASELAVRLLGSYPFAQIVASDCILYLIQARSRPRELLILEPDGSPLQYVRGSFVVSLCSDERWIYPINRVYRRIGQRCYTQFSQMVSAEELNRLKAISDIECNSWAIKKIDLVHPNAVRLCKGDARFQVELHDAFSASRHKCHVVRVMNLYNPRVLGDNAVAVGARAVFRSLLEGGIAVIGRSHEPEGGANHATLFRRCKSKLVPLGRFGRGSEVESVFASQEFGPIA